MNLVLENAMEEVSAENRVEIGTVVCYNSLKTIIYQILNTNQHKKVIRGNSVIMLEPLEVIA